MWASIYTTHVTYCVKSRSRSTPMLCSCELISNKPNVVSSVSALKPQRKLMCTLVQALRLCTGRTANRGSRGIAIPFIDHGTGRGEGSASRTCRSLHPGKTRYPLYRRLGGPQGRSGHVRKISPHRHSNPDRPARSWVAIPTELPGPHTKKKYSSHNDSYLEKFIYRVGM